MRTRSGIFLFLVSYSVVFGQTRLLMPVYILNEPQGFKVESLSGSGFSSSVGNTVFNIGYSNPASISEFRKWSFGFSNQFETSIDKSIMELFTIQFKRAKPWLPQSLGMVFPLKNLFIGLGFTQKYNLRKDYGEMYATVVDKTSDIGYKTIGSFDMYSDYVLRGYSLMIAYHIPRFEPLTLGIRYSMLSASYSYPRMDIDPSDTSRYFLSDVQMSSRRSSWSVGALYVNEKARFGVYYEKGADFTRIPLNGGDYLCGFYPDQWSLGASWRFIPRFTINGNVRYLIWDHASPYVYWRTFNQFEYSGSILSQVISNLKFSLSFLTTDYRTQAFMDEPISSSRAIYTSVGLIWSVREFDVDLAVADSHLFSDDLRKQTIFKIGLGYTP